MTFTFLKNYFYANFCIMKYLNLLILFILFVMGYGDLQAVSLPSNYSQTEVKSLGVSPLRNSNSPSKNTQKIEKGKKFKNILKLKKLKKALKPSPEFKVLDVLLILLIVILLLFVLLLLDGLTRGLLSALLLIALCVIIVLWLLGKI